MLSLGMSLASLSIINDKKSFSLENNKAADNCCEQIGYRNKCESQYVYKTD